MSLILSNNTPDNFNVWEVESQCEAKWTFVLGQKPSIAAYPRRQVVEKAPGLSSSMLSSQEPKMGDSPDEVFCGVQILYCLD